MTRAGSFVAERILGTSRSSVRPLLLILITRQPPSEDKRVTAKAGRRFVQNQDWWSRARLVTVPLVVPHDRSCAIELIRLFHASFTFSRPGLLRSQLMIGEHLSLLIAMAGANLGCYLWGKLFLDIILFSSALTQMNPNFWAPNIDESLNIANHSQTRFFPKKEDAISFSFNPRLMDVYSNRLGQIGLCVKSQ